MTEAGTQLKRSYATWLDWLTISETQRFLILSIFIGIFAGLMVVCFHIAIEFISWYSLGSFTGRYNLVRLIAPAVGGLVAAFLVLRVFRAAQGSGVNQTKAALYIYDGHVPFSTVLGKFLACSTAIGSGNSLGPEDPALQMGAGVASLLGRIFHLPRENMRLIAPVGAAAGIAAAFNTPITGVLFVMEEVVAGWSAAVVGSIVLAAVSAVVVVRWFLGNEPLFRVPHLEYVAPSDLIVYAAIGIAGGLLSALFIHLVERLHERVEHLPSWTKYARPVAAGLVVGIVGLWFPEVMGAGYGTIDNALHNRFLWDTLLALGLLKMMVTLFCFSAGTPGGMFAPTLFTGAMVGGGLGALALRYWPFPGGSTEAYVLVGMGTFFAGVFRAPMTSIFMVFEVSASYVIILPVMIANTVAYFISRSLHPVPFFTMLARQEGVDLPSAEERRTTAILRVEDAMQSPEIVPSGGTTVADALAYVQKLGQEWSLVSREYKGWSYIRLPELEAAVEAGKQEQTLRNVFPLPLAPRIYPDLALDTALRLLGSCPILPVTNRAHPDQLVGSLTLEDVHKAYGIEPRTAK
ncbi:MAG: chloride channel protein [Acidobacteria bacterium]|nr:chloride channel protein [Acidobacteriota bacterium]